MSLIETKKRRYKRKKKQKKTFREARRGRAAEQQINEIAKERKAVRSFLGSSRGLSMLGFD